MAILNKSVWTGALAALLILGSAQLALADDTEIYRVDEDALDLGRPKVLIIFDDSGSMSEVVPDSKPPFDAGGTWTARPLVNGQPLTLDIPAGRIYWTDDGSPPNTFAELEQWFPADVNRCGESYSPLNDVGYFQSKAGRWRQGETQRWRALQDFDNAPAHVECEADSFNENPDNGESWGDGYPVDDAAGPLSNMTPDEPGAPAWSIAKEYTFYSSQYVRFFYDPTRLQNRTRIDIAQEAVSSLITANPAVDFGLMEFNSNQRSGGSNPWNGGRIVSRIIEDMDTAQRQNVVDIVNSMTADGATPLCESAYEAFRYITGQPVLWGDDRQLPYEDPFNSIPDDAQERDTAAENPLLTYESPLSVCASVYVILMTDGRPTNDRAANDEIENLISGAGLSEPACQDYLFDSGQGLRKNCLPQLAEYMAITDLDDELDGEQHAFTYTIGFRTEQDLLRDTARLGNGEYFSAFTADELSAAFRGAILDILAQNTTFTSPAVAVDTFTRTQSRNEVFFSMFRPTEGIDWPGNIKKLEIQTVADQSVLVDANGDPAIDAGTGFIRSSASTFWSSSDGSNVVDGGVGGLLAERDPADRMLYTNAGAGGALVELVKDNLTPDFFDVGTEDDLELELAYARGYAIELENGSPVATESTREWVLGDILHSQPLIMNYGARVSPYTDDEPDLRIVVGTNAGFAHMFGSDDGVEDWAFLPKELGTNLPERRRDPTSPDHVYGMDLTPVAHFEDVNGDGNIRATDGDQAYLYLGMRRGGSAFYALDVSNPDSPAALWSIDRDVSGFEELGDTWSAPQVTYVPGHRDASGNPKPVLIFGAGYDEALDDVSGAFIPETPGAYDPCTPVCGRGIYVVDATTGELLWSVTPAPTSATNLQAANLEYPVAADVTPLDSNGDGLSDRIYFPDVGGHVWRVDIAGDKLPADMTAEERTCPVGSGRCLWHVNQLVDFNGAVAGGAVVDGTADRRFFNAVDVVRTRFNGVAIDALLIASGDRTNPNARDVRNRFYMVRDKQTSTYLTRRPTAGDCTSVADFRCVLPITEAVDAEGDAGLLDVTTNPFSDPDTTDAEIINTLSASNGWYFDLLKGADLGSSKFGEKGLARSLALGGTVFLTTFVPRPEEGAVETTDDDVCTPEAGSGYLYVIDLFDAQLVSVAIAPVIPDTPSIYYAEDGTISLLLPPGTKEGEFDGLEELDCTGGVCKTTLRLPAPYGNYWLEEGFQ